MSRENVEIVQRHIAAYNRRDLEALRKLSHSEMELDWSASRGLQADVYRGFEEVLRFYEGFLDMFEQVDVVPNRFIRSGESVVVPNTAYIEGRDGVKTVARSTLIFEVRGGLVARICLYQEMHEALEAAGAAGIGDALHGKQ
jgi:ketosteroid isomerase-like protein